jgi:hypothetical protein
MPIVYAVLSTIDHLTRCRLLAVNDYITRHDNVCAYLYFSIWKKLEIESAEN